MRKASIVIAVALIAALAALVPTAMSKSGDVTSAGTCTAGGESKLKVGPRGTNRLRVEFEVEHAAPGQAWNVTLKDNGTAIFQGGKTTNGLGKFEARKTTANQSGTDLIEAAATNAVTGETCTASLSL